jgi:integrase
MVFRHTFGTPRKEIMATIRKHYKKWQVIIRKRGIPRISKIFLKYSEAIRYAQELETQISKGMFVDFSEAMKITLADVLKRYRDEVCPTRKWGRLEVYKINKLLKNEIVDYALARISSNMIVKFRNELAKTKSASTVNKYLTFISVAYNTAKTEWDIECINPVSKVKRMVEPESTDERITPEEEQRLIEASRKSKMYWLEAILIVAIESGMRRGELLKLKRSDVDYIKRTAILRETKNGTTRKIGLSPRAVEQLKKLIPTIDGTYFPTSPDQLKFYWLQINRWSGLKKNFHLLRHEWASRMFERGWDISAVATQGGWKDWKVLRRYTALSPEYLANKFIQNN